MNLIPTARLVKLAALGLVLAFLVMLGAGSYRLVLFFDLLLLLLLLLDGILVQVGRIEVTGTLPNRSYVDKTTLLETKVSNVSRIGCSILIKVQTPENFDPREATKAAWLYPYFETNIDWELTTRFRGEVYLPPVVTRKRTRLGLIWRQQEWDIFKEAHPIFPRQELNTEERRLVSGLTSNQVGVLTRRFFGKGTEFEQLRPYSRDDDYRSIDWKSSARTGRHIVRTYRPELNQHVFVLLDVGRQMRPFQGGYSNLDWAIQTAQLLARVANGEGDRVGLLAFGSQIDTFLPSGRGVAHLNRMNEKLYKLCAETSEADYMGAAQFFHAAQKRRSLVALLTQIQDPESSAILKRAVASLLPRHLPLVVNIDEREVREKANAFPESVDDAFASSAATEVLLEKERFLNELQGTGISVLTVDPERAVVSTINRYLSYKRKGTL